MCSASFWIFIIFITGIVLKDPKYLEDSITIIGAFSVVSSLVFYAAPLINMIEIVKMKDSSSLYAPALVINGINCTLWFFYGLIGVNAVIVWLPNIIGLGLVAVELGMCCIYPAKRHKSIGFDGEAEPFNDYALYSSSRHMSVADMVFPINMMMNITSEKEVRARSDTRNPMSNPTSFKSSLKCIEEVKNPEEAEI